MRRRGQSAVEFMAISAFVLMLLLLFWFYVERDASAYKEELARASARNTLDRIREAADTVYVQGEPARVRMDIYVPEGVEEILIQNRTVEFRLQTSSGTADLYTTTLAQLEGNLSTGSTRYPITVAAAGDHVSITWQ